MQATLTNLTLTLELTCDSRAEAEAILDDLGERGVRCDIDNGPHGWRVSALVSDYADSEDFDLLVDIARSASQGVFAIVEDD